MKNSNNSTKGKQPSRNPAKPQGTTDLPKQTPAKPEGVTELTDQDLERVQGSQGKKWLPAN